MRNKTEFSLIPINSNKEHIEILYNLLKERVHNISHKQLPSYEEHKSFILNHPYREWFLVKSNGTYYGSIYVLDNNCIGINIDADNENIIKKSINWIASQIKPLPGIKSVRNKNFHININPNNKKMAKILSNLNADLIEHTYIIKQ
tara:strand:- start:286 stop:723 length:438 start_codon:yes stop_codon:yes gene_type:complete